MYSFLIGPMLWLSLLIFVGGLTWRAVQYVKGLDWRLERVAYAYGGKNGWKGALWSVFKWLIPFGTHSWRQQGFTAVAFFLFHLGVVIAPLFLAGHMVIMREMLGFSFPALPVWAGDVLAVCGIAGGLMLLVRRIVLEQVRFLSNWQDWSLLALCLLVLVSGVMARFQAEGYMNWLVMHVFCGELILILAPFTKLSHIVLFFMSRGQLGMDFAIKRGGATRGPAFPW